MWKLLDCWFNFHCLLYFAVSFYWLLLLWDYWIIYIYSNWKSCVFYFLLHFIQAISVSLLNLFCFCITCLYFFSFFSLVYVCFLVLSFLFVFLYLILGCLVLKENQFLALRFVCFFLLFFDIKFVKRRKQIVVDVQIWLAPFGLLFFFFWQISLTNESCV